MGLSRQLYEFAEAENHIFIATPGSKKYYIQYAYAIPDISEYKQETAPFDKILDSFKKIIIV